MISDKFDSARVHDKIGRVLAARGDFEEAVRYYRKALPYPQLANDIEHEVNLCIQIAAAHERLRQYEKAVELFSHALDAIHGVPEHPLREKLILKIKDVEQRSGRHL